MATKAPPEPKFRRHDSSGLTLAERNAVILYHNGAVEAAAKALGWTPAKTRALGSADRFIAAEVARIRTKVNERRRNPMKERDRLDEREAEPAPPPGEKLDERIEEVPPPPKDPPRREEEAEDGD